jgi:predicted Zn finger-like uncharacterized protein
MSLITSCPACGTMFRVVPDQLKISEGWVRCGHCSEVFDASANLSDESVLDALQDAQGTRSMGLPPESTEPPAPPPAPAAAVPPPAQRWADPPTVPAELRTRPAELYERPPTRSEDDDDGSAEPSDFFAEAEEVGPLEPSPLDAPFVFRRPEVSLTDLAEEPEPGTESYLLPEDLQPRDYDEEEVPNVSFVRKARRRSLWRRPFVRMLLALLFVVLAAALTLQIAYQDRDRLALTQPMLRPALEQMCAFLQCRIGPPQQIEAVVIDSSGFNRLRNDIYRISFTLRNSASVPVAVPAMELTVTDSQDQVLARRVLTPSELGAEDATIPAAGEWSRTIGVTLATGGTRVAGYRLLAFYP